jgi:1-acyl-sn-glycerol-3-phosphate acyltransferase
MNALLCLVRALVRGAYLLGLLIAAAMDFRLRRVESGAAGAIRIHRWCRRFVSAIGVSVEVIGEPPAGGAVVSNHLSYLDILLYSAVRPFVMVAKSEVRGWPLLGWLTAQAGTVYVERGGSPATYPAVNYAMAAAYRTGLPVLFFPEGTTTDASEVLPFRRGLFHSVLHCHVPLRTAALRYSLGESNGDATVADDVCWWGDALLAPHVARLLGLSGLKAQVRFERREVDGLDRFELAENARASVEAMVDSLQASEAVAYQVRHVLPDGPAARGAVTS